MGNCHLYKIAWFHTFGTPKSERLKVTALNLFHLTTSLPFQKVGFSYYDTVSCQRGVIPPFAKGREGGIYLQCEYNGLTNNFIRNRRLAL